MEVIKINGGKKLFGEVNIRGAKNSVVGLICAALLTDDVVVLENVPNISDVDTLIEIITELGCKVTYTPEELVIDSRGLSYCAVTSAAVGKMRASYYLMGTFISRFHEVEFSFPGGCDLGPRPIDLHLFGFEKLGCDITTENGVYHCKAKKLLGTKVFLDFASVGATINIMLAAVLADGVTTIENAAEEPEIVDIANFLNSMGAKVRGAGTSVIRIEGVANLSKTRHAVIPDRLVAGSYIILGALQSKSLKVNNIIPMHLDSLIAKLETSGVKLEIGDDYIKVFGGKNYKAFDTVTQTYPGYPTDLQQPLSVFLTQVKGMSVITETIYSSRFRHINYLNKMNANIKLSDASAIIMGPTKLIGNKVVATDLRASISLVLAGLIADGETIISNIHHLVRGYDNIIENLTALGADIEIIQVDEVSSSI